MLGWMNILAMPPAPGGSQGGNSPFFGFGMMIFLIILMYVVMFLPQRRKDKERRAMLAAVKSGDRVLFGSGIIGIVTNVKEKTLVIKIADKVKVEVLRGAVSQVLTGDELPSDVQPDTPASQSK